MSKLSVHYNDSGNHEGFGDFLKQCSDAKSPLAVVYSIDGNIWDTVKRNSPTTQIIYRRQTDCFNRLPENMFIGDPVINVTQWLTGLRDPADRGRTQLENWALNPADYYDCSNEPVPDTPQKAVWFNEWMVTAIKLAKAKGFRLALGSFATGSPPLECWQYMFPALRLGKTCGAILSLHAYWEQNDPTTDRYNALRYREIYKLLPSDCQLPVVITEASSGNGYDTGKRGQAWVDDMIRYDSELMKDPIVLSACGFQLGGGESNLQPALSALGNYISTHPTQKIVPPASKGHYLVSDTEGLRVRNLPRPDSNVLATVRKGVAVQVDPIPTMAGGYVWYKIVQAPYFNCYIAQQRSAENYAHLEVR